jgi:FMN-dependent NADH-azoreductase
MEAAAFSLLKAWIDQIVWMGTTFAYGPEGRQGLLGKLPIAAGSACAFSSIPEIPS